MVTVPLAHSGHRALWILYLLPVLILLTAILKTYLDQRREHREGRPIDAAR